MTQLQVLTALSLPLLNRRKSAYSKTCQSNNQNDIEICAYWRRFHSWFVFICSFVDRYPLASARHSVRMNFSSKFTEQKYFRLKNMFHCMFYFMFYYFVVKIIWCSPKLYGEKLFISKDPSVSVLSETLFRANFLYKETSNETWFSMKKIFLFVFCEEPWLVVLDDFVGYGCWR